MYLNTNFLADVIKDNHFCDIDCDPKINTEKINQFSMREILIYHRHYNITFINNLHCENMKRNRLHHHLQSKYCV